ncbi:MAG TPA: protein kinase, partial [Polyangia bacterium]|nr:protein kinase [Polyangia bacterium]
MSGDDGGDRPAIGQGTLVAGRYRVDAPLGAGGMSSVFAGQDSVLERPVALKLLRRKRGADALATERLLREAKLTARILHAACVQVFDAGVDPQVGAFLVMERLHGQDLGRFLRARGPLPVSLALGLFEQVCAIVHAVHQAGVVHRDLKPGNVFVVDQRAGAVPRVKLLDFGIARSESIDAAEAQLTDPGDLLGTLVYMAPERWQGASAPDARGDVYALGALLHEMLSGHPPFRGDTKAALRLAILNDPPPSLTVARGDVPAWLDAAVAGAMAKRPEDRPRDVAALATALGLRVSMEAAPAAESAFAGTGRFRVQRCLSRGADTEVYAALDLEQNRLVALKRLARPRGEAALRLKREFRTVAEVRHPNLVRLEALWEERGELLMTMELVEGSPLLDHVAGSEPRLRSCLAQLVEGLEALHARRLAHRDVKLENVLVDGAGRVVLLDGGLALGWRERGARAGGTPAYVAPEALEGEVGPEGDLYAVGVILRAALSGEPPSADSGPLDLARPLGPPARGPADLRELCARLLAADPAKRPTARQVREALRAPAGEPARSAPGASESAPAPDAFVGRADALAVLEAALEALDAGTPRIVWIEGESGIGKSALLDEFRRRLTARRDVVVLSGRARHADAVPFPALDEAIDELAGYLAALPPSVAEVLLPKRAARIARLFPSLASVPALARPAGDREAAADAAETRRIAFDGLRELLARLGDSRRVVVLLDDVQWIDADSRALLAHLLGAARPPALLVVGAARATSDGDELRKLDAALGARVQRLALGPLDPAEARALLAARWRGPGTLRADAAARLADEGRGVPFFLELLAVAARDRLDADGLDQVLAQRIGALSERPRRALELVCVAARPLPVDIVRVAGGLDGPAELDALISERLLRWTRVERGAALEPYHDKTRDAVRAALPEGAASAHHRALAAALDRGPSRAPELLIEHLARAGEAARATEIALAAARAAFEQLA